MTQRKCVVINKEKSLMSQFHSEALKILKLKFYQC